MNDNVSCFLQEFRFIVGGYWHIYYNLFFLQQNRPIILKGGNTKKNDNSMRKRIDIGKNDRNK